MNGISEKERLLRNLKDAGCDNATVETYLELERQGKQQEQLRLLSLHRATLLDRIHLNQNMIDCLDYLIYSKKKNK